MKAARAIPIAILMAGCRAATLTPAASSVQVMKAPGTCRAIGEVTASEGYNGQSREANEADALVTLRNKAAALGADAIVITSRETGRVGIFGAAPPSESMVGDACPNCVAMKATAYRCAPVSPR